VCVEREKENRVGDKKRNREDVREKFEVCVERERECVCV